MRRLVGSWASLSAGLAASQALTALAYVLVARAVEPAEFGKLAAAIGVATLVYAGADLGFTSWLVRELARAEPTSTSFATGLGVRLVVAASVGAAWGLVAAGLWAVGAAPAYLPALGIWVALALVWSTLLAPLRAAESMRAVAAVTAFERAVLLLAVGVCVAVGSPIAALPLGLALGAGAACLLAAVLVGHGHRRPARPALTEVRRTLRASAGFAASSLALQVQRLDVVLVGGVAGPAAAGIYAAAARLTNALGVLPTAFAAAIFPRAARRRFDGRSELGLGLPLLLGTMLVVVVPLFIVAEPLVVTVLGEPYRESGAVLRIVLLAMLLATLNQPIAVADTARGRERFVAAVVLVGSLAGLAGVAVGAAATGAEGAAWGLVLLQALVLLLLTARRSTRARAAVQRHRGPVDARL